MKPRTSFALGAMLVAAFFSSCSQQPSSMAPAQADSVSPSPAKERSGLATGWGDEKRAKTRQVGFTRSSSKPAGTDVVYYNDPAGIDGMSSRPRKVSGAQTAAGNMVEWGIKGGFGFLPTYKENGYGRRLVAGKKGSDYSIYIKNRTKSRLEIVASVDGLDVQDGKTANFAKRGYIIEPGDFLEIEGFRTSQNSIAKFEFSNVSNSYANLKYGDTRNVGVIGIAVFTEKGSNPWVSPEGQKRGDAQAFATAP
ncbi:hypothetical protein [Luteolibacter sp. AS25]|uniref:hypothetical protein n=1 Tax=Luteolibacter sp. AS25 TaxID=3135776 RepID=UPI00398AFFE3